MRNILNILIIIFTFSFLSENSYANVVSDSINQLIQSKNVNADSFSMKNDNKEINEKYHAFDSINQIFAFVIFYRSTCPHCQRFLPVLSQFANDYGFKVYPYSTDGKASISFPNSMPMTNQIEQTFFSSPNIEVPSLFLINVKTMKAYLIDQGEMSYVDLQNRVKLFFETFNAQMTSNE